MLSKTKRIEILFEKWKEKQNDESKESLLITMVVGGKITKDNFCKDGIIDDETYENEKRKILFITNEANDEEYSCEDIKVSSRVKDFIDYYETGHDCWKGKMRERICELYKVAAEIGKEDISNQDAALHFAFMNINKRGGGNSINNKDNKGKHIEEYCNYYREEIKNEIEIIDPDLIVWCGINTFDMGLHIKYLGAFVENNHALVCLNEKRVPIIRMWHTSYYQAKITPLEGYDNSTIGKLAAKLKVELDKCSDLLI